VGLFQKIKEFRVKRQQAAVEKNQKNLQNAKAIREDRVAASEFFCAHKEPAVAIPALLKRFEFSLDHGIYDAREKESAFGGILAFGASALPIVRDHVWTTSLIAWPLKIIEKLATEEEMVEILETCLDYTDVSLDADKTDKNYDILCHLREYPLQDPHKKMAPFLEAHDERIRYAAAEVLTHQPYSSDITKLLERFLVDHSAENTRLHQIVLDAYVEHKWKVVDPERLVKAGLPQGLFLASDGVLTPRS
jgi:hypothetical protein